MLFCFTYECVGFSFQPITRKYKKHQQQTNKQTKQKKQNKNNKQTKTKSIKKTLQLINNVMDIVYQNNVSNQR